MNRRGHLVLSLVFALLLASAGLALLTHTAGHRLAVAARRQRRLQAAGLEQELLLGLHRYRQQLAALDAAALAAPAESSFCAAAFPPWSGGGMAGRHEFTFRFQGSAEGFQARRVLDTIRVSDGRRQLAARAGVELLRGDIPAGEAGLLICGQEATAAAYLREHGVAAAAAVLPLVGRLPLVDGSRRFVAEALGLGGEFPDWRRIREAFGLEPGDAPIARGIYLKRDGDRVAAVFVEGDLQEIAFGAAGGWQLVRFRQDGRVSELRYRPGEDACLWSEGGASGGCFGETIIVHGGVLAVVQSGAAAFLDGARIELLANGCLAVNSALECENLRPGREKFPALLIRTCGRDFIHGGEIQADVTLAVRDGALVQAQIVAAGALLHGAGRAEIAGALVATAVANQGTLAVGGRNGGFRLDRFLHLADFAMLKDFRVDFIGEWDDGG